MTTTSQDLVGFVQERLSAKPEALSPRARSMIVAALHSDDALLACCDASPEEPAASRGGPAGTANDVGQVYLRSVAVEGFRGIGQRCELKLQPGPGLTVIAGRNGSGKSSLAEAMEVALTAGSYRWDKKYNHLGDTWRNLHHGQGSTITVDLVRSAGGVSRIRSVWPAGSQRAEVHTTVIENDGSEAAFDSLGWQAHLTNRRPFLFYDELGSLLENQAQLYDAVTQVLGLDQLADSQKRLEAAARSIGEDRKNATAQRKVLRARVEAVGHARPQEASGLLKKRQLDLDALTSLATGTAPDPGTAQLQRLAALPVPDPDHLTAAATELLTAHAAAEQLQTQINSTATVSVDLLQAAMRHHEEHGDGPCPVCATGVLDHTVVARAAELIGAQRETLERRDQSRRQAREAEARLRTGLTQVLGAVATPAPTTETDQLRVRANAACTALLALTDGQQSEPRAATEELVSVVSTLKEVASQELSLRDSEWSPLALELAEFVALERRAQASDPVVDDLKAAAGWTKQNLHELRNDRLRPLAERAGRIWRQLRQESNVELGTLTLEGSAGRVRRLAIEASVDGEKAPGFGVMSQGELNALSLAIFLPRASLPDSPFGFTIIDDPVQAMDPAKVDALARVFVAEAENRQLVVFTHDDRLPEAIRRLGLDARVIEVTRDSSSVVSVRSATRPAERDIADARALLYEDSLHDDIRRRALAHLLRSAVEAACRDVYFVRELGKGSPRHETEARWQAMRLTRERLMAAVGRDGVDWERWLEQRRRRAALAACSRAAHVGVQGDVKEAVGACETLVRDLYGLVNHV